MRRRPALRAPRHHRPHRVSSAKASRFRRVLAADGHPPEAVARIRTPIGLPELDRQGPGDHRRAVAADLLAILEEERASVGAPELRRGPATR